MVLGRLVEKMRNTGWMRTYLTILSSCDSCKLFEDFDLSPIGILLSRHDGSGDVVSFVEVLNENVRGWLPKGGEQCQCEGKQRILTRGGF